jgi:flagellar motor switch protein FliG
MIKSNEIIDYDAHKVASILACLPKHIRNPLIEQLQQLEPDIGALALRFDDLVYANDKGLNLLLKQVDYHDLTLAMVIAPSALQQRIYTLIGKQKAKDLSNDMTNALISAQMRNNIIPTAGKHPLFDEKDGIFAEIEIEALDAQMKIITVAADLRQSKQLIIDPPGFQPDYVDEKMIQSIASELQYACENAMAQVLSNYSPEAAAAVLCRRLDRDQILSQMLELEALDSFNSLNPQDMEQLLSSLLGLTEDD